MSALLERQTPGNIWRVANTARMYYPQQTTTPATERREQLSDLGDLHYQVANFGRQHGQLMSEIRRLYVMADERSVGDYFRSHRRLPQLLIDAEPQLRKFLGRTPISLFSTSDEQGWDMLYASVQWPGEPEEAMAALDRFDDAWWLANSYPAGTALTFTYKLV